LLEPTEQPVMDVVNEQLTSDQLMQVDVAVHAAEEVGDCCEVVPLLIQEEANAVDVLFRLLLESR
jgi:hypothetical protein